MIEDLTAAEIAVRYRTGGLHPSDLVEALFARVDRHEDDVHAFITLDRADVREQARRVEADRAAGVDRGPLHGIPVGIKDVIDVAGQPTTCCSRLRLDHRAATDAAVVARLRAAGAIIFGKLNTHEFAIGGPSFDLLFPPARNPWDLSRHPGGSSSGSGAALAAGFVPLAIGTDTGGSIRHPAGACGVVGFKPTPGLVPRAGVFPVSWSLDVIGPMGRSVADAASLLQAMSGRAVPSPDPAPVEGMRIGFVRHFHERDVEADPQVADALEAVAETFARLGATILPVDLPPLADFAVANRVILTAEAWSVHAATLRTRAEQYGSLSRQRILVGAFLRAEDLVTAERRRTVLTRAVDAAFDGVDLLITANSMDPPCAIDDPEAIASNYGRQARIPFNLTGHPALAVPCGLTMEGMPLSFQLIGPRGADERVLAAGMTYEAVSGWGGTRPDLGRSQGAAATMR